MAGLGKIVLCEHAALVGGRWCLLRVTEEPLFTSLPAEVGQGWAAFLHVTELPKGSVGTVKVLCRSTRVAPGESDGDLVFEYEAEFRLAPDEVSLAVVVDLLGAYIPDESPLDVRVLVDNHFVDVGTIKIRKAQDRSV